MDHKQHQMSQQLNNNNESEHDHRNLDNGDHVSRFLIFIYLLLR